MPSVAEVLAALPARHRAALQWFSDRAGSIQPWPGELSTVDGPTLLASKAKGIYKPEWSEYALSVRQTLGGPYPDQEPVYLPDRSWLYRYFQEDMDPRSRDSKYTNRGLIACWHDGVPIGVMRQVSPKPKSRYRILGLARVTSWDGGYFYIAGAGSSGELPPRGPSCEVELMVRGQESLGQQQSAFDPASVTDGRERAMAQIVRRRGQPEFRVKLLDAYGHRCAISGCDAAMALEAAHIAPYQGPSTNRVDNGLLLRADLHTLFDLGLTSVDAETFAVLIAPELKKSSYSALAGAKMRVPQDPACRPSIAALKAHREWSGL